MWVSSALLHPSLENKWMYWLTMGKTVLLPFLAQIELGSVVISQGKVFSRTLKLLMIHLRVQFFLGSTKVSGTAAEAEQFLKPFSVCQGFCLFLTHNVLLNSEKEALLVITWVTLGMVRQTCTELKAELMCVWHFKTIPHIHVMTKRQPWRAKMQLETWRVKISLLIFCLSLPIW